MDAGRKLVIRADAGPEIGTGHVMRALTLGQAWREAGGQVDFVTANATDPLIARLEKEEFFVHLLPKAHPAPEDWEGTARAFTGGENLWLVLDGYHFDAAYHERARGAGVSILVVDDMAQLDRYAVDIVLNQNAHARSLEYEHPPGTRLLLGLDYVLLRQEFQLDARSIRGTPRTARRILVTFGGVDPLHLTERSIEALNRLALSDLEATVITTSENAERAALKTAVQASPHSIHLEVNLVDMTKSMEWADLALCSGGTTVWELAFMGVPSLVIATSPPERLLTEGLDQVGLFETWCPGGEVHPRGLAMRLENLIRDAHWRKEMSSLGRRLVDGRGRDRVLAKMSEPEGTG